MRGKKSIKLPIVIYIQILCDYRQIVQLEMNQNKLHSYTQTYKKLFFHPFILTREGFYTKQKNRKCIENFCRGLFGYFLSPSNKKICLMCVLTQSHAQSHFAMFIFFHRYFYFTAEKRSFWVRQFKQKNTLTCSIQRAWKRGLNGAFRKAN